MAQDWPKSGAPLVGKGALVPLTPTLATAVATAGSRTPKSKLEEGNKDTVLIWHISVLINDYHAEASSLISPTHKRTEGRAPVWGSEFTSKRRRTTGGIQQKPL